MNQEGARIHIVDALRGFAIVSIILLHHVQHFYFNYPVNSGPEWMINLDHFITIILSALFSGKSYGIFALLFGLTFYIQSNNQKLKGRNFNKRFAWRLIILMVFGFVNSAFYAGDIISFYAVFGFLLIPFSKLNDKTVCIAGIILLLQPVEWIRLITGLINPGSVSEQLTPWAYYREMEDYIAGQSLVNTWIGNLKTGKIATIIYSLHSGRIFQTAGLFLFGMLAGRNSIFILRDTTIKKWIRVLLITPLIFVTLSLLKESLTNIADSHNFKDPLVNILESSTNMVFMLFLIAAFILLINKKRLAKYLNLFSLFGRMSLTNYIMQSVVGSFIYFGYGLGLYKDTGATYCLLIGITSLMLQGLFSHFWLRKHKRGPLESIWHKLTWIRSS